MGPLTAAVLLSASYPDDLRRDESGESSPQDIGLALSAVVEEVLSRGLELVFGGHPTITPVVYEVAGQVTKRDKRLKREPRLRIRLFQSAYFSESYPPETQLLADRYGAEVIVTEAGVSTGDTSAQQASVAIMRSRMLATEPVAAFFIGGMKGIHEEYVRLRQCQPACTVFLFTRPGGRAALIARDVLDGVEADDPTPTIVVPDPGHPVLVLTGRGYHWLTAAALDRAMADAAPTR